MESAVIKNPERTIAMKVFSVDKYLYVIGTRFHNYIHLFIVKDAECPESMLYFIALSKLNIQY